jgi:hypothetical protein
MDTRTLRRLGYPAVIPTVAGMTSSASRRLAYDDASPADRMTSDCRAVAEALRRPAPSLRFEHYPREVAKPTLEVSVAAARLAAALHLHLD